VHLGVVGLPSLTPTDDLQWLVHLAVGAGVIGLVEALIPDKKSVRWLLRLGLAFVTFWLVLGFKIESTWASDEAAIWLAALTLVTLGIIHTFETLAERYRGAYAALAMVLVGTAAALGLVLGGTAKVAQLTGGLTAAAGVFMIFSWWRARIDVSHGAATVFSVLFAGLLAFGYMTTTDVPEFSKLFESHQTLAILLVASAPFLLWVAMLNWFEGLSSWARTACVTAVLALPLAGGVYLAANPVEQPEEENKLEGVDYDSMYQ
jgi:hypothetical protein